MRNVVGCQRLLVATDFSTHADAALRQAIWMARETGAELGLLNVIPDLVNATWFSPSSVDMGVIGCDIHEFQDKYREHTLSRLRLLADNMDVGNLGIHYSVETSNPWLAIIRQVQREHIDMVFLGAGSHSSWGRRLLGSTAQRVANMCPAPVWITTDAAPKVPLKVLGAVDFSSASRSAANLALKISLQAGAEFHLAHVVDSGDVPPGLIEQISPGHTLYDQIHASAQHNLSEFVGLLGNDSSQVKTHICWGSPAREVLNLARQLDIDLLALGSHGRSGIQGLLLGNTAEKVLSNAVRQVLIVKPEGFVSQV